MKKKTEQAPTYTGVTKEELARQQSQYEQTIGLLSQQNSALSSQYGDLTKRYESDYNQKIGLLSGQLNDQKSYYDQLLQNANTSLAQSQQQTALTAEKYSQLDEAQKKQLALTEAETTRSSLMQRENQAKVATSVSQQTANRGQQKRRARASLLRPNTN